MIWSEVEVHELDVRRARELVDGYAACDAPYLESGEPSWFPTSDAARVYWNEHAADIVAWARNHGFAHPRAALRYGTPRNARMALFAWAS